MKYKIVHNFHFHSWWKIGSVADLINFYFCCDPEHTSGFAGLLLQRYSEQRGEK
jgi:hypothetical protein